MSDLIIYPNKKLNNLERRTLARAELAHFPDFDLFRYLCTTQHARHYRAKDGVYWHTIVDVVNIVYCPKDMKADFEPRFVWNNLRTRLKKSDKQLCEKIAHAKLPSWDDHRWYPTDIINTGWLYFLLAGMHTPITDLMRAIEAERMNQKEREKYAGKVQLLDREIHGVGSEIQLLMQSIYEVGDYDDPIVPPGLYEK